MGVKRTWPDGVGNDAFDPKQTSTGGLESHRLMVHAVRRSVAAKTHQDFVYDSSAMPLLLKQCDQK